MSFDYIIVGAGSAGCVLADRLSEHPSNRVLLLEVGPRDDNFLIHMPKGNGRLIGDPKYNHFYATEPEPGNGGKPEYWLRGSMLGGSSSINGMVYNRGQPADYDQLEALGCTGWNWASVLPHFKAIEDNPRGASAWTGTGGPVRLAVVPPRNPVAKAVVAAGEALGLHRLDDLNGASHGTGVIGSMAHNIGGGRRMSSATAFLKRAAGRPNLQVETGKRVDRLLLENGQATGVRCLDGTEYTAGREVILTAGALESPCILMRSGIGPAEELRALGITVAVDAPEVGRNLIEHRVLAMQYKVQSYKYSDNNRYSGARLYANVARYMVARSGVMAQGSFEIAGFLRALPAATRPDAMFLFAPYAFDPTKTPLAMQDEPAITFFASGLRPESRGSLSLRSADPSDKPILRSNYFDAPNDREIAINTTRFIRQMVASAPLRDIVTAEKTPGFGVQTDDEILDTWRQSGGTGYHTVGTCGMGSHPTSVLDPNLCVRGVSGVRVMDASIFPHMVSGHTNAPIMMAANRAADLIIAAARLNSQAA